tara:strand:+ start:881 stop:1450 length:570 start_codon:yes stop_codon:yes gene_type:complete
MAIFEVIDQTIVEGDDSATLGVASVSHTIPAGYEHLKVCVIAKTNSTSTNYYDSLKTTINADTNNAYYLNQLYGSGSSAGGSNGVTQISWYTGLVSSRDRPMTKAYGVAEMVFANASGTSNYKGQFTKTYNNQYQRSSTEGTVYNLIAYQHHYRDASRDARITSIGFAPYTGSLFLRGSVFTTYGIKSS